MKLALILLAQMVLSTTLATAQTGPNHPEFTCQEIGEPSSQYSQLSVYRESMDDHYRAVYLLKLKIKGTEQTQSRYFEDDAMAFHRNISDRQYYANLFDKAGSDSKLIGELHLIPNADFDLSIIYQTPYGGANTDYFKCQFKY